MSRASAVAVAPVSSIARDDLEDNDLVAQVRRGNDRAFEVLFERYRGQVTGYAAGMVKDHARAEDVTQEVFISALRRMRATERPIAFKPWIYEIAKNACIDQYRRSKRGEEISYDVDGGLGPSDQRRLVAVDAAPHDQVHARQQLRDLCGAFGDLSESHHRILVLRELEGRSYREIGEEMGMSRPAVESTLFRARRRLTEEYSELVTGRRCERVQAIITSHSGGRLGARDERRMARHLSYCQPCRHHARVMGVEIDVTAQPSLLARASAWMFPVPAFLRGRRGGSGGDSLVSQWSVSLGTHAEPLGSSLAKAAAAAATLAVATLGSGVVNPQSPFASGERGATVQRAIPQRATGGAKPAMTPGVARRDDRRPSVQTPRGRIVMTPAYELATDPALGGLDRAPDASAPPPSRKGESGGAGSVRTPAATTPDRDEILRQVDTTAKGGGPRDVEVPPVDTPVGSTPKVTATPQAPAPEATPAPPGVSTQGLPAAPSTAGDAAVPSTVGAAVDTGVGKLTVAAG